MPERFGVGEYAERGPEEFEEIADIIGDARADMRGVANQIGGYTKSWADTMEAVGQAAQQMRGVPSASEDYYGQMADLDAEIATRYEAEYRGVRQAAQQMRDTPTVSAGIGDVLREQQATYEVAQRIADSEVQRVQQMRAAYEQTGQASREAIDARVQSQMSLRQLELESLGATMQTIQQTRNAAMQMRTMPEELASLRGTMATIAEAEVQEASPVTAEAEVQEVSPAAGEILREPGGAGAAYSWGDVSEIQQTIQQLGAGLSEVDPQSLEWQGIYEAIEYMSEVQLPAARSAEAAGGADVGDETPTRGLSWALKTMLGKETGGYGGPPTGGKRKWEQLWGGGGRSADWRERRREMVYQMWYLRTMQGQVDVLGSLGERIADTTAEWGQYAGQARAAGRTMRGVAAAHGEATGRLTGFEAALVDVGYTATEARETLTALIESGVDMGLAVSRLAREAGKTNEVMMDSSYWSARLSEEYGEHLLPAQDALTMTTNEMRRAFVEADDSIQITITTGAVMAQTFLDVSAGIGSGLVSLAEFKTAADALLPVLGLSGAAATALAGAVGLVAAAMAGATVVTQEHLAQLEAQDRRLMQASESYDEYKDAASGVNEQTAAVITGLMGATTVIPGLSDALAANETEWESTKAAIEDYNTAIEMTSEQVVQMAMTSQAMLPEVAMAFGDLARTQEEYAGDMETLEREHQVLMAEAMEEGMTDRLQREIEQNEARQARLETQEEGAIERQRRQLGKMAMEYVGAWGEITGELGVAWETQLQVGEEFGVFGPEGTAQARQFMEQLRGGAFGDVPWGEAITGAAGVYDVALAENTAALNKLTAALEAKPGVYIDPAIAQRTSADELQRLMKAVYIDPAIAQRAGTDELQKLMKEAQMESVVMR